MEPLAADDPRQVGVFGLQSRLGAGGMGRVYLGRSPGGRAVAIKVVHPELARDPEFMSRFRREVQAAEAVSGAYTAPVLGAGPDDHPPWLATAFVAGPSLAELVTQAGPLPEAAVWRLASGLTEALQAIHGCGLVHRDLKPGNILIAADGPRVIDFGISRALQGTVITAARTTMGTPAYMSPEQAEGRAIGPPSDVFSFGSVITFAATGIAPFAGGDTFSIAYRIVQGEPDLSRLPPGLRDLVAGCLAKDPVSRPSLARLMDAAHAGSAYFPAIAPGQFWPGPVYALVAGQSRPIPGPAPMAGTAAGMEAAGVTHAVDHVSQALTIRPLTALDTSSGSGRRASRRMLLAVGGALAVTAALGAALALVLRPASPSHGTAAPASSPIAVTVCTDPAISCSLPGAARYMEVRPKVITLAADGTGSVNNLVWSGWGGPRATATGTLDINNCNPDCAQGTFSGYPATVTLAGLKPYGTGLEAYSTIVIQSPSANTTETFTRDTVP